MPLLMHDTADSNFQGGVPGAAEAVLCYMDGSFANEIAARRRFPHLSADKRVVALTCRDNVADGVDWEPGNTCPNPASWYDLAHGHQVVRPIFYADLSDFKGSILPVLEQHLGSLGAPGPGRPVRILTAHPGTSLGEHLCGPRTCGQLPIDADGTQYWWGSIEGHGKVDEDKSIVRDDFFLTKPPLDPHYERFATGPFLLGKVKLDERTVVQQYDKFRAMQTNTVHPHRPELAVLRAHLKFLHGRVNFEAISHHNDWGSSWRWWRRPQLLRRANGERLV